MNSAPHPVGISFGPLRTFHDGLGEFSLQLGRQLAAMAPALRESDGIEFHFHLPRRLHGRFGDAVRYLATHDLQRLLHLSTTRFALWHSVQQHNRFRPPLFAQRRVQTVHDLNFLYAKDGPKIRKYVAIHERLLAGCDAVVTISDHVRQDIARHLKVKAPVQVIHNGVRDLTGVKPDVLRPLEGKRFFFHISRMAPTKNIPALLELARAWPERQFVLAGPQSDYATQIGFEIDSRGLENVVLLQDVKDGQKAWLYANCEAFLFPSLTEGFGLPPLEAMQFGKPVFLSDRTCLPEIGGDCAFYWHDFAPLAMRGVVEQGLAGWQAAVHGPRARQRAAQFTWERCAKGYVDLYRSLLAGR